MMKSLRHLPEGHHKRVLGDVPGQIEICQDRNRCTVGVLLVSTNQFSEAGVVAPTSRTDQCGVGGLDH
jgi:hypothetical protein